MARNVIIGCADQGIAYDLRSQLAETIDVNVLGVAENTSELVTMVAERDVNIVFVHDLLGPDSVHQTIRDLSIRRPSVVPILISSTQDRDVLAAAMDSGTRGILSLPFTYTEVQQRLASAFEWSEQLIDRLGTGDSSRGQSSSRAVVITFTGSKGGVGVTTFATHLAWDVRHEVPSLKVLIIDLDLEKGDVTSMIEARARTSIADLAKVSQDISMRAVADSVIEHESGLHLLLPPDEIRDTEWVTPSSIRQIIGTVRQQYDLVIIDGGSHVTPVQAAAVEISDEVVAVVTPGLVSLRGLRRNVRWWESLSVRKADSVRVLLNRRSRQDELQPDAIKQISPSPMMETIFSDVGRKLEGGSNSRSPDLVVDQQWWKLIRSIGQELGVVRQQVAEMQGYPVGQNPTSLNYVSQPEPAKTRGSRGIRGRRGPDRGSLSLEFAALIPMILLVILAMWQLTLAGMTYVWTGHAASAAARSVTLRQSPAETRDAALKELPVGLRDDAKINVNPSDPSQLTVTTQIPLVAPGVFSSPWTVDVERKVVREP